MSTLKAENGEVLEVKEAIVLTSEGEQISSPRSHFGPRFGPPFGKEQPHSPFNAQVRVFKINGLLGLIFPILFLIATVVFLFALGGSLFTFLLIGWAAMTLFRVGSRIFGIQR